jgi:hypothetical protein
VQAQKAAVSEQLASAKRNFEVGTSTITDSARGAGALRPGDVRRKSPPRTTCA